MLLSWSLYDNNDNNDNDYCLFVSNGNFMYSHVQALEESGEKPKSGGFSFKGLSSMIFGADTPESRQAKITTLNEQIQDAENNVETTKEEVA